jgi:hypothetical protein
MTQNSKTNQDTQKRAANQTSTEDMDQPVGISALRWQQPAPELWAPRTALEDHISLRAYERFVARGREIGHDVDDWLRAEIDVLRGPQACKPNEP